MRPMDTYKPVNVPKTAMNKNTRKDADQIMFDVADALYFKVNISFFIICIKFFYRGKHQLSTKNT